MNPDLIREAIALARRPYTIEIVPDETTDGDSAYTAFVRELEGCLGQGATAEEAEADVRLAMIDFIASLLEDGLPVPEPAEHANVTATHGTAVVLDPLPKPERTKADEGRRQHIGSFTIVPARF